MVSALDSGSSGPGLLTLRWSIPSRGGVEIFLVTSCYGNRDKLQPGEPLGSNADFTDQPI